MSIEIYQTEVQNIREEIKELDMCIEMTERDLSVVINDGDYADYLSELLGDQYARKEKLTDSIEYYMQYA